MSVIPSEHIGNILVNVALKLRVKYYRYEKKQFDDIAQNYFGVLIPISLTILDSNNCTDLQIVLKLAPIDERYRVSGAVTAMFAREIFIYTKVLYMYQKLQEFFPQCVQYIMPKLYYASDEYCKESIVLENMCAKGYKPYINNMFLDSNHIKIALQSLARFHALSIILNEKESMVYNEVKEICVPLNEKTNKRFMDIMIDRLKKARKVFENTDYKFQIDLLIDSCAKLIENASTKIKCLCICHGDIWKENILFQYEDNLPVSACLIDYQTTRMCSLAFDVLYLILSSTNSEVRCSYFKNLLVIYYESLSQSLALGNVNNKYSYEMLEYDLKIVGPACFIVANTALWLANGLQEEGHVKSKIQWTTVQEKISAVEKYKNIIKNLIDDLTGYGYFQLL